MNEEQKQRAAPSGYKLVPVEPTPEMRDAGHCAAWRGIPSLFDDGDAANVYRAMLAAAPAAPTQPDPEIGRAERYRRIAIAAMCCRKIEFNEGGPVYDAAGGLMDSFDPEAVVVSGSGQRFVSDNIGDALLEMYRAEFEPEEAAIAAEKGGA